MAEATSFKDAPRELGLTGAAEKRLLLWLAARVPAAVNSDHLTALGLVGMLGAGLAYALSGPRPWLLLAVNAFLVVNWLGDSLDGTLARFRNRGRPRYGFYVDHVVDMFGALFLLGGLALSPYMSAPVAVAVLLAYFMLGIHVYLATHVLGVFKIAFAGLGGTELRLLAAAGNLAVLFVPRVQVAGFSVLLYDAVGAAAAAGLLVVLLVAVARSTRRLYELERLPDPAPAQHRGGGLGLERRRQVEALAGSAIELAQQGELFGRLDSLRHRVQIEAAGERDRGADHLRLAARLAERLGEGAVDLEAVEGEAVQGAQ
jgi:phosphatidylglycerophosphate synthase